MHVRAHVQIGEGHLWELPLVLEVSSAGLPAVPAAPEGPSESSHLRPCLRPAGPACVSAHGLGSTRVALGQKRRQGIAHRVNDEPRTPGGLVPTARAAARRRPAQGSAGSLPEVQKAGPSRLSFFADTRGIRVALSSGLTRMN